MVVADRIGPELVVRKDTGEFTHARVRYPRRPRLCSARLTSLLDASVNVGDHLRLKLIDASLGDGLLRLQLGRADLDVVFDSHELVLRVALQILKFIEDLAHGI